MFCEDKMKNKRKNYICTVALLLLLLSCSDGRPDVTEAKKQFEQLYPGAQIISIRMTEDEVIARSFEFHYRKTDDQKESEIEIQYMKNPETQRWELKPNPQRKRH